MRKHSKKFLTILLSACMVLTLLPMAAMADTYVFPELFRDEDAHFNDFDEREEIFSPDLIRRSPEKVIVDSKDYEHFILWDDRYYEFVGIGSPFSPEHGGDPIDNGVTQLEIPPFPENGTEEEIDAWLAEYGHITMAYAPHDHDTRNMPWKYNLTNHWKICRRCGAQAMINWHHDADKDGICDDCSMPIHYYKITVKETTGGKVEVSQEKAMLNDSIQVTVTPDPGWHLKELHFFNLNEMHSELTRWEDVPGSQYHFIILPWDADVEAVFEKD